LWPVTDRLFRTTARSFWIRRCRDCSIEYLHPQPTAAELATYYPESYWVGPAAGRGVFRRLLEAYRRLVLVDHVRFVRRIVRQQRAAGSFDRLLDVGCGDGSFLDACGVRPAMGLDWSPTAVQAVSARGFPAVRGTLPRAPFRDGTFSIVTMFHYLEHVAPVRDHLESVRHLLRPGGRLVVQVPNADSWQSRILRSRWAGYDPPRHLINYSTATLRRTLTEHGFRLVRQTHLSLRDNPTTLVNSLAPQLYPPAVSARSPDGLRGRVASVGYLASVLAAAPLCQLEAVAGKGAAVMCEAEPLGPEEPGVEPAGVSPRTAGIPRPRRGR
jgi:SAM-dependent methyltransferase